MTNKEKVQSLLDAINYKTGADYLDLTSAISALLTSESPSYDIDVTSLADYWQNEVADAFNYAVGLGSGWIHNVVVADSHYNINHRKFIPIAKVLMATGLFRLFIHLGDLTDATRLDQFSNVLADGIEDLNGKMLFVLGNHDNLYSTDGTRLTDSSSYRDKLMSKMPVTYFDEDRMVYYYDDMPKKTRYISMGYHPSNGMQERFDWAYDRVIELDSTWTCVFLSHGCIIQNSVYNDHRTPNNLDALLSDATCKIVGWWAGHEHIDDLTTYRGFNQVCFIGDLNINLAQDGDGTHQYLTKHAGTVDENAVTIVSFNKKTNVVKYHRIGNCYTEALGKDFEHSIYVPSEAPVPATLESISAIYSGGNVPTGTSVSDLVGIVVTGHYSDGTTKTENGWSISGTIAEGNNTITISFNGKTTTITVVGESIADGTEWADGVPYELNLKNNVYVAQATQCGSEAAYNGWSATDYLPCNGASTITRTGLTTAQAYGCFYTLDKVGIKTAGGGFKTSEMTINVPTNACWYRLSDSETNMQKITLTPNASSV